MAHHARPKLFGPRTLRRRIKLEPPVLAAAVVAAALVLSACPSGDSGPPPGTSAASGARAAPPSSSATTATTAGSQIKTVDGYVWSARLDGPFTTASTVQWGTGAGDTGHVLNSPPGRAFVVAKVVLRNDSDRAEPGFTDIGNPGPQTPDPLMFVITQSAAGTVGLKVVTFNASNWGGPGPPPKDPQCVLASTTYTVIHTYGTLCDLGAATANLFTMTAVATNEGSGMDRPQLQPGQSQELTIFVGPIPQSAPLSAISVVAVGQGASGDAVTRVR